MWQEIWSTVQSEFSDIPDATQITRIMLRLLVAALLGGLLGYEREQHGKSAGVRTHMLVAIGAALFVLIPQQAGASTADLTRVLAEPLGASREEHFRATVGFAQGQQHGCIHMPAAWAHTVEHALVPGRCRGWL